MKNIRIIYLACVLLPVFFAGGCTDYLEEEADNVFTQEQIFSDNNLIESAIANLYGRVDWGQSFSNITSYTELDEAAYGWGAPSSTAQFFQNHWRIYEYGLMREMNIFLEGLYSDAAMNNRQLTEDMRRHYEGEVRFLRAWLYFNMCERLGGLPLIGDKVYEYEGESQIPKMYIARSTEEETYDYIISECNAVAEYFLADVDDPATNINAARATKWAALALKARAAIYAGSIAKYNIANNCLIQTSGLEVGIPEEKASKFYRIAYDAAREIIEGGKFRLYEQNSDKALNFYDLFVKKDSNPEVIWALDYIYPGKTHDWTNYNYASAVKSQDFANAVLPVLNLVEDFEYVDNRNGELKIRNGADYVYYDNPEDLFKDKDPRLWGTVIYPGASFRSTRIEYQAGILDKSSGSFRTVTGTPGQTDAQYGGVVTSINGPVANNDLYMNKTGFNVRKYVSENLDQGARGSDVWFIRFRYAEVLMIASEAALELGYTGEALDYINQIRDRAGISRLESMTIEDIQRERRVEFAFENHRWWDAKRFRIAHAIWNATDDARLYSLFPYKVYAPGEPEIDGKWVFEKTPCYMKTYPLYFDRMCYYNGIDDAWITANPLLKKNPFQ